MRGGDASHGEPAGPGPRREFPHDLEGLRRRLVECMALKEVAREGWRRAGVEAPESVAAHSWGVAWLVLALAPAGIDRGKALAMAVLHDLAEVHTGDRIPQEVGDPAAKRSEEEAALADLLGPLPRRRDLVALWREVEEESSAEGRFVKACDRLDMALQAARYEAQGVEVAQFVASALARLEDPLLRALAGG